MAAIGEDGITPPVDESDNGPATDGFDRGTGVTGAKTTQEPIPPGPEVWIERGLPLPWEGIKSLWQKARR